MGLFTGVSKAQLSESGTYFEPGFEFEVEIVRCIEKHTRKSGDCFIVECKILNVQNIEGTGLAPRVGDMRTYCLKASDRNMFEPKILAFATAVLGKNPRNRSEVDEVREEVEPILEAAIGPEQAFKGTRVITRTYSKETKSGGMFTHHEWVPVGDAVI